MSTKTISVGFSRDLEIFETPDPTEKDKKYDNDQTSSSVEVLDESFHSSFGKFKGKSINKNSSDFSDNIRRPLQFGFKSEPEDFELNYRRSNETILQRYHRLKQEVADLMTDVESLKDSEKELHNVSPGDVIDDLNQLQQQLHQLELDRSMDTSVLTGAEHSTYHSVLKELQTQLCATKASSASSESGPVYEVYANVESAKFGHLSKLSDIENRIAILEGLVGKPSSKGSILAGELDAEHKDLSSAVLSIQSKVALLDVSHIQTVTGKLQTLLSAIRKVDETKRDTAGETDKIAEALETVASVAPLAHLLPDVIDRLHTLKELHEHAAQLSNTVTSVSENQEKLEANITTLSSLLEQVQSTVGDNVSTIQSNLSNLESRIAALQK